MPESPNKLRVAAISYLNPAPLMWDFDHEPTAGVLASRYDLHYTLPSQCAAELLAGTADLGLIPVAALTPELAIVPGCAIASLRQVRSILLMVRLQAARSLAEVRTVSVDRASRSSVAYTQVLFRHFLQRDPEFLEHEAEPIRMLQHADAALIIGDPALLAREHRAAIEEVVGPCLWIDLAEEWVNRTGLPWVAAVWAVRPEALGDRLSATQLIDDLQQSRDHGLANIDALVEGWRPRLAVPPDLIRRYLTENIYYQLDDRCMGALRLFRELAASVGALPPLGDPLLLGAGVAALVAE